MKSFLIIFVIFTIFCCGSSSQDDDRTSRVISNINEVIFHAFDVLLREKMRSGNPETGFPILAPLQVPSAAVSWQFGHLVDLDGELRNVRVDGLDSYRISDARLSLLTMRFVFDFTWPQVLATGWYNLNGRFGGLIPIFGQGNFRLDPRSECYLPFD
jgi:hypothetical protein